MLQLIGSNNKKEIMKNLRSTFIAKSPPKIKSLKAALKILKITDLTKTVEHIRVPTTIIVGENDKLTPKEASLYMGDKIKNSCLRWRSIQWLQGQIGRLLQHKQVLRAAYRSSIQF